MSRLALEVVSVLVTLLVLIGGTVTLLIARAIDAVLDRTI